MNSLDTMEVGIRSQLQDHANIRIFKPRKNCLFVGSGDSFAVSLAAEYASGFRTRSFHPEDILYNPCVVDCRVVYFVSVSGRTKANIRAARAATNRGSRTVAVTASPDSPLAASCDRVIQIKYSKESVSTAGTASFFTTLFTCLSLATDIAIPASVGKLFALAEKEADEFAKRLQSVTGSFYILANGILFPIAMYGALKLNEVIGAKAHACSLEEFCHSPLFSVTKRDAVMTMGSENDRAKVLATKLSQRGFTSIHVDLAGQGWVNDVLHCTFLVQLLALKLARQKGLKDCYFIRNRDLLDLSSELIYD